MSSVSNGRANECLLSFIMTKKPEDTFGQLRTCLLTGKCLVARGPRSHLPNASDRRDDSAAGGKPGGAQGARHGSGRGQRHGHIEREGHGVAPPAMAGRHRRSAVPSGRPGHAGEGCACRASGRGIGLGSAGNAVVIAMLHPNSRVTIAVTHHAIRTPGHSDADKSIVCRTSSQPFGGRCKESRHTSARDGGQPPMTSDAGVREWAWMAVRPVLAAELDPGVALLLPWSGEESERLRRIASEASLPRASGARTSPRRGTTGRPRCRCSRRCGPARRATCSSSSATG